MKFFVLFADISKNRFSEIPPDVCQYPSTEKLICHHNVIKNIPQALVQLQSLVKLNLRWVLRHTFYLPLVKLRGGNVFSLVSVCLQVVPVQGLTPYPWHVQLGLHCAGTPPPMFKLVHCEAVLLVSRCLAFDWNAFLLQMQSPVNTRRNAASPVTFATEIGSVLNNPPPKEFETRSQTPKNTSGISLQI